MLLSAYIIPLLALRTYAQMTLTGTNSATSTAADYPTGASLTYATETSVSTRETSSESGSLRSASINSSTVITTSQSRTLLVGGQGTTTSTVLNSTATHTGTAPSTSTSAEPTNTQPCNGHPEFCNRKYSNITYVAAHNSPFVRQGNAASNQMLPVEVQLEDGVRMLQFQTHDINGTIYLCHSSCDILNVGTLEAYLTTVTVWLRAHPYDIITVLMGNSDVLHPQRYVDPVANSGLIDFVYTTPEVPMPLESWPTLSEMILTNQRAVVMLDYEADQNSIPWLLDEFSQMWETPFSPTDRAFPCTPERPPNRLREIREDRMYMTNHNLNVEIALAGISLDVPAFTVMNETNAISGQGSAGWAVGNCTENWNRPPNFLLVDYYNLGSFNGSVFQVAATANNVTYDRGSCCGNVAGLTSGVSTGKSIDVVTIAAVAALSMLVLL